MTTQAPPKIESAYRAMRDGSGLLDPGRETLEVVGVEGVEFLQGQVTNDVEALEPGRGCYALLLNPKGRILADVRILMRAPDRLWLDAEPIETARAQLSKYTIGRQVEVRSGQASIRSLIGPAAASAAGVEPPATEHSFVEASIDGVECLVVRTHAGVDVWFPRDRESWADARLGDRATASVPPEAAEIARIESGRPRYGLDMTDDNLPGELGLEARAISFTKGCYVGQEPVARMHYKGHPNRHLRGLRLSRPAARGERLEREGREMGGVSSACVSPELGPIALGLVRRQVEPGEELGLGDHGSATVVELPFRGD